LSKVAKIVKIVKLLKLVSNVIIVRRNIKNIQIIIEKIYVRSFSNLVSENVELSHRKLLHRKMFRFYEK
jgi:hypothetical protein